jgi:hypothetical protein
MKMKDDMREELVDKIAKCIALELGFEWNSPVLEKGSGNVPSREEFLGAAQTALSAMEASGTDATAPCGRGLPNITNKANSEASASSNRQREDGFVVRLLKKDEAYDVVDTAARALLFYKYAKMTGE